MIFHKLKILLMFFCVFTSQVQAVFYGSAVYADASASGGNNDGGGATTGPFVPTDSNNWSNAYEGFTGLQTALDGNSYSFSFTSGSTEPAVGAVITGNTSGGTARVCQVLTTSGVWGSGTAAGKIYFAYGNGTSFQAETVDVDGGTGDDHLTCSGVEAADGHYIIFARNNYTATTNLDIDAADTALGYRMYVIACSGTSGPVAIGSYVTIDASGVSGGLNESLIDLDGRDRGTWRGFYFKDPHGDDPLTSAAAAEYGVSQTAATYDHYFVNCKFTGGYAGYGAVGAGAGGVIGCEFSGSRVYSVNSISHGAEVIGCSFSGTLPSGDRHLGAMGGAGTLILFNNIAGETDGVGGMTAAYGHHVLFNNFSDITGYVLDGDDDGSILFLGNVIEGTCSGINDTGATGNIECLWNTFKDSGNDSFLIESFWGTPFWNYDDQAFSDTDPWISQSGANWRLNRTQTIADNIFDTITGIAYFGSSTATPKFSGGGFIGSDIPTAANTTSSDTSYFTTGTASGGGVYPPGNKTGGKQN